MITVKTGSEHSAFKNYLDIKFKKSDFKKIYLYHLNLIFLK